MFRILITFAFIPAILAEDMALNYVALGIAVIAAVSDWLDGHLARKYNLISNFGKVMDPLADKILVFGALLCFVHLGVAPVWMVIIIIARDFFINGIRQLAAEEGRIIAASNWGKAKTVVELIAIIAILILLAVKRTLIHYGVDLDAMEFMDMQTGKFLEKYIPYWLMFLATAMSLISGLEYYFKNIKIFDRQL